MDGRPLNQLIRQLRRVAVARAGAELSDGQLLERFVARCDHEAFAALVRRHGPMVLGVCRRILRRSHDADDAFQATFLVLLRKAGTIRRREQVSNWLFGVAYRSALKARAQAARRREQPLEGHDVTAPVAEVVWRELRPLLDEEINRLPGKYRRPVVLHYLEGKTRRETARELGWPEGTVSVRLARAREWLRRRLERRGLALSAGAVAAALGQIEPAAAVPISLAAATVRLAAIGLTPAQVTALAEAVLRAMFFAKLQLFAETLAICLGLTGGGFIVHAAVGTSGAARQPAQIVADAPKAGNAADAQAAKGTADRGAGEAAMPPGAMRFQLAGPIYSCAFSPDGRLLAALIDSEVHIWEPATGKQVKQFAALKGPSGAVAFAPDGTSVAAGTAAGVYVRDVATGTLQWGNRQAAVRALAYSPDGQTLISGGDDRQFTIWQRATGRVFATFQGNQGAFLALACAPDGKMLAAAGQDGSMVLADLRTGRLLRKIHGHQAASTAVAFSPDGRTLATASEDKTVRTWDLATGAQQRQFSGHQGPVHAVAFTPDGRQLISGGADAALILWDADTGKLLRRVVRHRGPISTVAVSSDGKWLASGGEDGAVLVSTREGLRDAQMKPIALSARQLDELWSDLARDDAARGYQAVRTMIAGGKDATPFLKEKLKPAARPKVPPEIRRWIKELDDDAFAVREKATKQLQNAGRSAEKLVRQALSDAPTPEARRRLAELLVRLEKPGPASPEDLRASRAVEILERVGSPEARDVLSQLARGAPGVDLTQQAQEALKRLSRRGAPMP